MSICRDCKLQNGRACCEVEGDEKLATLTAADIARIEEATGLAEHRFVEREALSDDARREYEEARPLYKGLFDGGVRLGLKAKSGACVFLKAGEGCTLSWDARPVACRLYPFDFDASLSLTIVDAPHCLALEKADGEESLLALFGQSRATLERLRDLAREDVARHSADTQRRACR